jgi:hypothetical protein
LKDPLIIYLFRCNFAVRNLADNIHTYTVQCSLPINLFNEKIFLIIWFWLYLTTVVTLFGFIYWVVSFFYPQFYKSNIVRYLSSMRRINIHHFPQNPFQEQMHHHHRSHHHHHNRRYSYGHHHHHHSLLSSFASRTLKPNFDTSRLSRTRDQLNIPTSTERENTGSNVTSTPEEQSAPPTPTPQRRTATQSDAVSVTNVDSRVVASFLSDYLGRDGTLVLYILRINSNEVITGEIVTTLFELYKTNYRTNITE